MEPRSHFRVLAASKSDTAPARATLFVLAAIMARYASVQMPSVLVSGSAREVRGRRVEFAVRDLRLIPSVAARPAASPGPCRTFQAAGALPCAQARG